MNMNLRLRPDALGATGLLMMLVGATLLVCGTWLAILGGTWYYVAAGAALAISGWLLLAGSGLGLWIYAALLAGTLVWAVTEVGFDGWKLMPRLLLPVLFGVWLCLPWVWRTLTGAGVDARTSAPIHPAALVAAMVLLSVGAMGFGWSHTTYTVAASKPLAIASVHDANGNFDEDDALVADGDWRFYGRTMAGLRYSPLHQITPNNVRRLELAWSARTGDLPRPGENSQGREFNFENTPVKMGDTLYVCTPHRWILALDATSGAIRWKYTPKNEVSKNAYLACRGVSYYEAPSADSCPRRIISTTADARLFALDADTGKPCENFGVAGFVSLTTNMGKVPPGFHFITSPALVVRDRIILGGWVYDNQAENEPSGVVRAFDARSGALSWAWDMGRSDPTAPLAAGEIYTRGTPNGWGAYTADPELGLVYVPLGNPAPDYWGGHRRVFDDKYSSSLVALEIDTGKERWHYQTVHHDLWDFDLPIGPSLVDFDTPEGPVPALVQTTKLGDLFVLDRRTGEPLREVDEVGVPQGAARGDRVTPTQRRSVGMPSLAPQALRPADLWGATPLDQMWCRIQFRERHHTGPFTPPSQQGNIAYPAFDGVVDWYGATIDPVHHLLIANSSYIPFTTQLMPAEDAIEHGLIQPWAGWNSNAPPPPAKNFADAPQYGTPFAAIVKPWLGPLGVPCHAPPWGLLTAIDLNTHEIRWQHPVGTTRDTGPLGTHFNLPLHTGIFNIGGNVVTGGGLVFMAATADRYLRAFDEASGQKLWQVRLPAGGQATPMTYRGKDGRQYVVIAAGGHGGLGTRSGDYILAYALPDTRVAAR